MASDAHLYHDRTGWEALVKRILGEIPETASGDDVERMTSALRSVSALMRKLGAEDVPAPTQAQAQAA